jgi:uncharacterized protein YbjT (DUF2867 family)
MRILVIGGTGFIGGSLIPRLLDAGGMRPNEIRARPDRRPRAGQLSDPRLT